MSTNKQTDNKDSNNKKRSNLEIEEEKQSQES